MRASSRWTAAGRLATAATVAGVLLVGALHTPVVRQRVLRWALGQLATYGVEGRVARLDYNLFALDFHLHNLTLSRSGYAAAPFFEADEIHVNVGWPFLLGRWAVQAIEITRPTVTYVRAQDGASNWPLLTAASPRALGQAPSRPIDSLMVHDLAVSWHDAVDAFTFELPRASIELNRSKGRCGRSSQSRGAGASSMA